MEKIKRSFLPLFATNFFGVVNDNFLKILVSFYIMDWVADKKLEPVVTAATAAALVLPYILFSPLADRLTAVFEKKRIFRLAKWAELPIVGLAIAGIALKVPAVVFAAVLLMGLQSALYSPAKYALVRDVGGEDRISTGMGGMEGVTFLAVLAGTIGASLSIGRIPQVFQYVALSGFALLGLLFSYRIRADEQKNRALHAINPVRYLCRARRMARKYPGLNALIVTLSVFWWAAATLQLGLLNYGEQVLCLDRMYTGAILALAAIGIVSGQVIAGFVDRRHYLMGVTVLTGWIAAGLLCGMFFVTEKADAWVFASLVGVLSFDLGFFKLPLDAEIQKVVKGPKLNTMLAYFNQVSFLFMLGASGTYALVSWAFAARAFLIMLAVVLLIVPIWFALHYRGLLLVTGRWIFRRRYDVELTGIETMKKDRTYLVLPNHPAMVDPMLVTAELWRTPVIPLADELFLNRGGISGLVLRTLGAVAVPDLRKHRSAGGARIARGLTDVVTDALSEGKNVIFYPSGHIWTSPREEIGTRQLAYNACRALPPDVEVVCVRTLGLWGSMWSRKGLSDSPSFGKTFVRAVLRWMWVLVSRRRRKVTMHFENMTAQVKEWSALPRLEFNRRLEAWYNEGELS